MSLRSHTDTPHTHTHVHPPHTHRYSRTQCTRTTVARGFSAVTVTVAFQLLPSALRLTCVCVCWPAPLCVCVRWEITWTSDREGNWYVLPSMLQSILSGFRAAKTTETVVQIAPNRPFDLWPLSLFIWYAFCISYSERHGKKVILYVKKVIFNRKIIVPCSYKQI